MNIIENVPIPVCGLILALFSLGNLLMDFNMSLKYLCGAVGCIFLLLILLKLLFYPSKIKDDLKNPIFASNSGTFSMSLMIISTYLAPYMPTLGYGVWILGVILHILLIIYFTYHFIIHNFNISNVYPSYWIVYVGITMGAITAHIHGLKEIAYIFFVFGFISMLITLPLIIYRYIKYNNIPDANKPLICIFTAVMSILIVGYVNSMNLSNEFIVTLYILACIFYIFSLLKFIEYRKLDFYPSYAAFTFPFVISATATKEVCNILKIDVLNTVFTMETLIVVVIMIYVLIRYTKFLIKIEK